MILELTTTPNLDLYGGPLAFASVAPWTIEVETAPAETLSNRTHAAIRQFVNQYGTGFAFRAIFDLPQEYVAAYHEDWLIFAITSRPGCTRRGLADSLGVESVQLSRDQRRLTAPELAAASAINAAIPYHYTLTIDDRPDPTIPSVYPTGDRWQWTLHDEQARKNLARAAQAVGVEIVP